MSKTSKADMFPEASFHEGATFDFFKPRSAAFVEHYEFEASMTRQEFADECDINTIMARYERTGELPRTAVEPQFADYSDVPDLMTAMDILSRAQDDFMRLPAVVRRTFDNDPVQFVAFASDPDNLDQMRRWELAPPAPPERPTVAPIVPGGVDSPAPAAPAGEAPKPA